jgi:hypothetical protein
MADRAPRRTDDLLRAVLGPGDPEISCDACFDALDRYVELEIAGADADQAIPGMAEHLRGCPACAEDHASLRALLAEENPAS